MHFMDGITGLNYADKTNVLRMKYGKTFQIKMIYPAHTTYDKGELFMIKLGTKEERLEKI